MSIRTALQVIGLLTVCYLLFLALLAMGPIGWLVFVPMLVFGLVQAHRKRSQRRASDRGGPNYCPNCGSEIDTDWFDETAADAERGGSSDADWTVRYCPDCGAPLETVADDRSDCDDGSTGGDRRSSPANCPDCGAPNDPDRATCKHCDAALEKP